MKASDGIFSLILIGAIFAFFSWLLVGGITQTLLPQYRAESFPITAGTIESAKVVAYKTTKGHVRYRPDIAYFYAVDGHHFWGRRYRYDDFPSDSASVNQIVNDYPRGSTVEVYYNPADPADTVLSTKVMAGDISTIFMLAPLPLYMVFLWFKTIRQIEWPGRPKPLAGGIQIINEPMTTRIRLARYRAEMLGLAIAGFLSFVTGLVFQTAKPAAPMSAAGLFLPLIAIAGIIVYWWQHGKIAAGLQDLVIHEGQRTFELPLTYKRRERHPLPISQINAVFLEKIEFPRGGALYIPTLEMQDGTSERLIILRKNQAEAFAKWLSEKIRHPGRPG